MGGLNLLKGLLIGLVVFVALNFVSHIIYYALSDVVTLADWFEAWKDNPMLVTEAFFGYAIWTPTLALTPFGASGTVEIEEYLYWGIMPFVTCGIAAILAGFFAEEKFNAFGAWFLIAMISGVILFIGYLAQVDFDTNYLNNSIYVTYFGFSAVVGLAYSFLAILASGKSSY